MPLPYISESETSSSEAETLRSTPPASPPAFPSNSNSSTASSNDDDVRFQSRKVRRAKKHLLGALVCCYAILAREAGEQVQAGPIAREREPWTSLIVHLKRLPTRAASLESCESGLIPRILLTARCFGKAGFSPDRPRGVKRIRP